MPVIALSYGGYALSYNGFRLGYYTTPTTPNTLMLLFETGVIPVFAKGTGRQLSTNPNIWELRANFSNWSSLLANQGDLLAVYGISRGASYEDIRINTMEGMFAGCEKLYYVTDDIYSRCYYVTNMSNMFQACHRLQTIPTLDTHNTVDMGGMFYAATSMTEAPVLDTHNVVNFFGMFGECTNLVDVSNVSNYDTSKAEDMGYMFYNNSSLEHLPTLDTHNVYGFQYMCCGCTSLREVPLLNTSSCIDNEDSDCRCMFKDCVSVEHGALDLYNQISTQPGGYPNNRKSEMFRNCGVNTTTGAAELAQIPAAWK